MEKLHQAVVKVTEAHQQLEAHTDQQVTQHHPHHHRPPHHHQLAQPAPTPPSHA